jgi:hypothetical protein
VLVGISKEGSRGSRLDTPSACIRLGRGARDASGFTLPELVWLGELHGLDSAVRTAASNSEAYLSACPGRKAEYSVTAKATNGDEFTVSRKAAGEITHVCVGPLTKTGCSGGAKSSW